MNLQFNVNVIILSCALVINCGQFITQQTGSFGGLVVRKCGVWLVYICVENVGSGKYGVWKMWGLSGYRLSTSTSGIAEALSQCDPNL